MTHCGTVVDALTVADVGIDILTHVLTAHPHVHLPSPFLCQVRWALAEDTFEGALLTPRLRRLRFRGGAQEMTTGFNTEQLDSEFSVVSVR